MFEAYDLTRKDGAPGVDGVTADDYEANLEANLMDLVKRIKSGRYAAPPVRRRYIPKADGRAMAFGHFNTGRQGGAAGDLDVAEADLRDGLSALFVWLSARPLSS